MPDVATTMLETNYRISHWPVQLIGYGTFVFATALSVLAFYTHQPQATLLALPWSMLGLYLGLRTGTTIITATQVTHLCPLGKYAIDWRRVAQIEYDQQGNCFILHGPNQRLVLPGTIFWTGKQKRAALQFIEDLVQQYQIQVRESLSAPYKISKNTRR